MAETEIDAKHIDALNNLEDEFEDAEVELLRYQHKITKDLFVKRKEAVSKIPNFWALAFEQAPAEIDEYVHPSDAQVLVQALENIDVQRFELPNGDPRSISVTFEFKDNEFFSNKTLTKKFWWRYSKDGWAGHVSEPVKIDWKEGKDLTSGMLDLVHAVWEEEKAGKGADEESESKTKLKAQLDEAGIEGVSFFGWFGFRGRHVTEEESKEAAKIEQEKRARRKAGETVDDDDEDEEDDIDEYETEIFPTGDDVAVCFAEDFFPNAIRYFNDACLIAAALEDDEVSEMDFEDDEDAEMEEADEQPSKKRKA